MYAVGERAFLASLAQLGVLEILASPLYGGILFPEVVEVGGEAAAFCLPLAAPGLAGLLCGMVQGLAQ